ncbi:maltokinase N-terminal cap-like domain-containing protein [Streptomyces griseus]|uniref:maltokinase N-terminal cap-like domain-containing protein n=1 Tax=Streptomyces griseus TaxID=1911 RepID=UPI00083FFC1F|nr:1,4-alpha-glucan branching protein [Streptomyces griseus]
MAVIHRTTMEPTKLQLLAPWLPTRPWYTGPAGGAELTPAGGFRLDDPEGEVGIELMVVTDTSGERPVPYLVPLTYRGAPLEGADEALVGTSEHGVLGRRWVYDGAHDPVLAAQLLALFAGRTEPQAQSLTDTPDPTVAVHPTGAAHPAVVTSPTVRDGRHGTDIVLGTSSEGGQAASAVIAVTRVLRAEEPVTRTGGAEARGQVTAGWRLPDGGEARGPFFTLFDERL